MEHFEKMISLNFNRRDFEEIYFKNNQDSILLSPIIKRELVTLIIASFLLLVSIIYSLLTDKNAWLIVILSTFTIISFISYYYKALQILKWRKGIKDYLNKNEKFKSHKLILTDNSLSLIQDDNEEISKWSTFTLVEITEDYLILKGTTQYFFPKKSMIPEDYNYFIQEIKSHVKNGI